MQEKNKRKKNVIKQLKIIVKKREIVISILSALSSLLFSFVSFGFALVTEKKDLVFWSLSVITGVAFTMGIISLVLLFSNFKQVKKYQKDYCYYSESKRIADALLTAMKRTEFEKTNSILRSTYGNVPDWHPINYNENVLIYDVHEQLRKICVEIKQMIVSLVPNELNDDMVTVDIAFKYPSDNQFFVFEDGTDKKVSDAVCLCTMREDPTKGYKIITSGDRTSLDVHLHKYLKDKASFYCYLDNVGYAFCNDKKELNEKNHYLWTTKDNEHGRIGSIVGSIVQLKNDNPELVFVSAYVTVSTYGRKFVEDSDVLDKCTFEKLFKSTIINSYKTIIENELAHMFIRHGIRNGIIDRKSGRMKLKPSCEKRD